MAAARPNGCSAWAAGRGQGGCAAAAGWLGRRRRRYEARARGPGREEEEDVARGGEMAAENKPEGKSWSVRGWGRRGGQRDPAPPDIPGIGGAGRERGGAAAAAAAGGRPGPGRGRRVGGRSAAGS